MTTYEVTMTHTGTGADIVVEIEARSAAEAERKVRAVYGRPDTKIVATAAVPHE